MSRQERIDLPMAKPTIREMVRERLRDFRYRQAARDQRRRAKTQSRAVRQEGVRQESLFGLEGR
jgi:hypothetical protein